MQKINYNNLMIDTMQVCNKEKLLLHTCCAVCVGGVLEKEFLLFDKTDKKRLVKLTDIFDVTLYFYNPNIDTRQEYDLRAGELNKIKNHFNVKVIVQDYDHDSYLTKIKGLENYAEQGDRCTNCIAMRIDGTVARARGEYDYVGSSLTISPHKNAVLVNECGKSAVSGTGIEWLNSDFKKAGGFMLASLVAKKLDIYRQAYCGCEFAKGHLQK